MQPLSKKVDHFSDSLIRRMTRIAMQYDAINLSQGFPEFDPPKEITEALKTVADSGPHQYEITWGSALFRSRLAARASQTMGLNIDPDKHVVVTCGGTEAMMCAVMTLCDPGDKVIIFSPFYENYSADTLLNGAIPIYVPLIPPTFEFDLQTLEEAFQQGVKALILCNPSNPSGKVFTRSELLSIAELAEKYDTYVITDEVYEHLVYAPSEHVYFASLPNMAKRTLSTSSLSKTYSITGWRIGYIIAPEEIMIRLKMVHDFLTVGAPAPLQRAAAEGLILPEQYYTDLLALYTHNRDLFLNGLDEIGLSYYKPQGAYFVMVDISAYNPFPDDLQFCEWLIREVGVAAVPASCFFAEPEYRYIRFHFAKNDDTLRAALQRLSTLKDKAKLIQTN